MEPMNFSRLPLEVVLVLNVLWFGAGAIYFGLTAVSAAKLLVPRSARTSPLFRTVSASLPFLGGMNLVLSVLSGVLLFDPTIFPLDRQVSVLAAILALAHGTQFAANVPVVRAGHGRSDAPWPVLRGPMLFIFLMDFTLMLANGAIALSMRH